jgi:hypothetical protein
MTAEEIEKYLGVATGDKSIKIEPVLKNEQLFTIGVVFFIAFFVSTFLGNLIFIKKR